MPSTTPPPQEAIIAVPDGSADRARSALSNSTTGTARISVPSVGNNRLLIFQLDPDIALDKLVIELGGLAPSYLA